MIEKTEHCRWDKC